MTLADWIIGFTFGFGVAVCLLGLWRALRDEEPNKRLDLRLPPETSNVGEVDLAVHYASEQGTEATRTETLP